MPLALHSEGRYHRGHMKLSTKLLLLTSIVSLVGFGGLSWLMLSRNTRELVKAEQGRSNAVAESVVTGIQNVMLTGKGILAEEFVQDIRKGGHVADLRVYDQEGIEVYVPREKRVGALSHAAADAVESGREQRDGNLLLRPLANDESCQTCHSEPAKHRGALSVELSEGASRSLLSDVVKVALTHVMLSGEASEVDGYLVRLAESAEVERAFVLDPEAKPSFGAGKEIAPAITDGAKAVIATGKAQTVGDVMLTVVPNAAACHVCHGDDHTVRGVIGVEVAKGTGAESSSTSLVETASTLVEKSLIQLMLSERGNQLDGYLTELRSLPAFAAVNLFDEKGREIYPPAPKVSRGAPAKDDRVFEALRSGVAQGAEDGDWFTAIVPLPNDVRCQACHGSDHTVRGIVRVQADLRPARAAILATTQWAGSLFGAFAILSAIVLFAFVRRVLVKPVMEVSRAARRVGDGDLTINLTHLSRDEVGDLSRSMNEMITGLRGKLMMERFVGDHTRRMIQESVAGARSHDGPVRRSITVLFSDVRGFTSYSEQHPPERVIQTLNVYLGIQTECVERHGGYVDKFVGDEIMALFEGEDREYRAVRAALEMVKAVEDAQVGDKMTVGIGVNAGDVVFGSTGSEGRQDYTVIGDVVNLAARLCSAAGSQSVLISDPVLNALDARVGGRASGGIEVVETSEMSVKGKVNAVRVHRVKVEGS